MSHTERNRLLLFTALLLIQPLLGMLFSPEAFDGFAARMQVYAHLTIKPLPSDMPLSSAMGPVLALLVLLCGVAGIVQLLWRGKTPLLRALYIFTFIWILLRGGLYLIILPGSDARLPLLAGLAALTVWGWLSMKAGNPMFRSKRGA
ncbi:MAG: hypothetical protein IM638_09790 [Bacteroidetes bacterium]|nr:hypothetical protein [Bacteroidota bacterium]